MNIKQIRNAALIIEYAGKKFLYIQYLVIKELINLLKIHLDKTKIIH